MSYFFYMIGTERKGGDMQAGDIIVRELDRLGMSQLELARQVGVAPRTVYMWVSNRASPKLTLARKVADVLGISLDVLSGREPGSDIRLEYIERVYGNLNEDGREYLRQAAAGAALVPEFLQECPEGEIRA